MIQRSRRPRIETLESRLAPAVNIFFDGSNLTVTGDATGPGAELNVVVGPSDVSILDGAVPRGTYAVTGNVTIRLGNVSQDVNFDFGGNALPGSLTIALGNGGNEVNFQAADGTINGSLSITSGSGADDVFADISALTVAGNATVNLGAGADLFFLDDGASIGGNLTVQNVQDFSFAAAAPSSVGGLLSVTSTESLNAIYEIGIGGNATVNGLVAITGGSGGDNISLSGNFLGNVVVNLGNAPLLGGSNVLTFAAGTIGGSLTVTTGNGGTDSVDLSTGTTVGGNVSINLGNGINTVNVSGAVLGSSFTYFGGSAVDQLNINATAALSGAYLNVNLGAGDDTLVLSSNLIGRAYIDFGFGADTFTANAVVNFPLTTRNL